MMQSIKNGIRWLMPHGIMKKRHEKFLEQCRQQYVAKENIIRKYFTGLIREEQSPEIVEIINYFEKYKFTVLKDLVNYPYEFVRKYRSSDIDVFLDTSCKMSFVLHNGKKLYFPSKWTNEMICEYYNMLCVEQDEESPHRYETKDFTVKHGDIIADVGAAEGIWALNCVENARKIYLFEYETEWIKALQKTFEPWKEKVSVVNKYVSNTNDRRKVSLDVFFKDKTINFIKADIEGAEIELLEGAKSILTKASDLKLLLCAYHKHDDAENLKKILEINGFVTEYSKRYMLVIYDEILKEPYIRRGIIRAKQRNIPLTQKD